MPYDEGMTKLIYSGVLPHELGYSMSLMEDPKAFQKAASAIGDVNYADLAPDKDHVGIHLIALGEVERYGFNRNGDGFPKVACIAYHDTFVKNGHVYRHHNNKDPEKRLGDIKMSAYTEPMGRIELFIHAHKEKAAPELEKLEKTGEVPFSMACRVQFDRCYPVGTQVLTPTGNTPIERLVEGDYVLSHRGISRKVTATHHNSFTGVMVTLYATGIGHTSMTANHPVFVIRREKLYSDAGRRYTLVEGTNTARYFNKELGDIAAAYEVAEAATVRPGDHLLIPAIDLSDSEEVNKDDFMYLAGVYAGDGYFLKDRRGRNKLGEPYVTGVAISVGDDNVHAEELAATAVRLCGSECVRSYAEGEGKKASRLTIRDRKLADDLASLVGEYCYNKHIDLSKISTRREGLSFLGGLIDSDGSVDPEKQNIRIRTVSTALAYDTWRLCYSCGVPASVNWAPASDISGFRHTRGGLWLIHIGRAAGGALIPYSKKLEACVCHSRTRGNSQRWGDYWVIGVNRVEHEETDALPVYNLTVDIDETYIADGVATHNCSICNNVRKSSKDPAMCDHVRDELGKVAEDGRVTGTYNDEPNFFDISFVYRPADRIAWHLKVASAGTEDSVTLAMESGLWTPESLAVVSKTAKAKLGLLHKIASMERHLFGLSQKQPHQMSDRDRELWELRKAAAVTQTLDDSTIDKLRAYDIDDVLYHTAADGIVLDPPSFFKYATGSEYKHIADYVSRVNEVLNAGFFSQLEKSGSVVDVCNDGFFDINVDPFRELAHQSPRKLIAGTRGESSFIDKYASHRTVVATIERRPAEIVQNEEFWTEKQASGVVKDLAERYASYKLAAVLALQALNPEQDLERQLASVTAQHLIKR